MTAEPQAPPTSSCPVSHFDHTDPANNELSLRPRYAELVPDKVSWSGAHGGFWVLSGFEEIRAAERQSVEFSCAVNGVFHPDNRPPGTRGLALEQDPPESQPYRAFFLSWLSRGRLAAFGPAVEELTARYVDDFAARGGGNFVTEVSEKLPVEVICQLLEIPDRGVEFRQLSQQQSQGDPEAPGKLFGGVFAEVAARRAQPRGDFLSSLLDSTIDGQPMPDQVAAGLAMGAFIAGHETNLVAGSGLALELARDPELQQRLRADPALIPTLVDECLRLHAPVQNFFRTMTADVALAGQTLRRGDRVMLLFGAANLDPAQFPDPLRLDLDRAQAGRHLSYGYGTHRCAGATLAELELSVLAKALLKHEFRLAGPVGYGSPTNSGSFIGFTDVPLAVLRAGDENDENEGDRMRNDPAGLA